MGNLGWYQLMTTVAKKVGGPINFILLIAGSGAGAALGGTTLKKKVDKALEEKRREAEASTVHTVNCDGQSNEGLLFKVGDQFRVLDIDGKAALVDIIGNANSPYFVSTDFLSTISDFNSYKQ